ncbi:GNAT family N-acetyltransferase [Nocardioides guangzhouensis]|uniref:GNAT family N-acetyltransferase n=1 Tax=Nocardioides guangzhouensis TaxID=2497878 RepID=A0A4Q4Z1K1_9ACTN|nr:GNAT family N-acetyltransferase [Nocardioides guangzhouensis]RYP81487.1 GNAT family N-acetyltransferase [Nocardioides guangzhouensis]
MLTTREGVHVLSTSDLTEFLALAEADPVVNVFVDYRARTTRLDRRWLGGEVWGRFVDGRMVSACHVGANLVPVQAGPDDIAAFADRASGPRRGVASIVGPQPAVEGLWRCLVDSWGAPRELRLGQPHLQIDGPPAVPPDPAVRRTTMAEFDVVYPACVDFYTEELGISPEYGGGGSFYRARVQQLISKGWQFARIEDGRVLFKAEVGCVSPYAAQIQGVYVDPDRRGEGLGAAGMAAVVDAVRREIAPVASLYVNEFNLSARRAYEKAGFRETARFSTVMF